MYIKILYESGLVGRKDFCSGRIFREEKQPRYGVIFTSNDEQDLILEPDLVLGTFIGTRDADETEKDLFFEILGGYYYHDNWPEPGITTHVFGIALTAEFGINEGAAITLNDNWKLEHPEKPILDESYYSKEYGHHRGWTFIVTLKPMETYPQRDEKLKILAYCPEIKDIQVTIGRCRTKYGKSGRMVSFSPIIDGSQPTRWFWDFGDGSTKSGEGWPPDKNYQFYPNKPEKAPKLCLIGPGPCQETCKEADISGYKECPPCPEIINFEHRITSEDENSQSIQSTVVIKGDPPASFDWDWGDGSAGETTTGPAASHTYPKLESGPVQYPVKVTIDGPNDCQDTFETTIEIPGKVTCPKIKEIMVKLGECKTEGVTRVRRISFSAVVEGDKPDVWTWHFGDGSTESGRNYPPATVDHFYSQKPSQVVKLCLSGPLPCQETCMEVRLSEFQECPACPQITGIDHTTSDKDKNTRSFKFTTIVTGAQPEKFDWDWGDGSARETTTGPVGSHDYKIPTGGINKHTVKVSSTGPEDCQDSFQKNIEIPALPARKIPRYCFWLPLIVAFLISTTLGCLIGYSVVEICLPGYDYEWLVPVIIIHICLTILAIFSWYYLARKTICPGPTKCDWLGIGWIVMLTGFWVSYFMKDCCQGWWLTVVILFVITAIFLLLLWLSKCKVKVKTIVFHAIVWLLATVYIYLVIANKIVASCL